MENAGIFDRSLSVLEQALTIRSQKHNLTVSNIANIDTPHFKAFNLVVEEEMAKMAESGRAGECCKTHPAHFSAHGQETTITPKRIATTQTVMRADGNTVDLDAAMADLSENTILYTALAQIVAKKFEGMINAVEGGK